MASTMQRNNSPAGSSPLGFDILPSEDESWTFMDPASGSQTGPSSSVGFVPSPASRSLASYGVIIHQDPGHRGPSSSLSSLGLSPAPVNSPEQISMQMPPTSSPVPLPSNQQAATFPESNQQPTAFPMQFANQMPSSIGVSDVLEASTIAETQYTMSTAEPLSSGVNDQFMQLQNMFLFDQDIRELVPFPAGFQTTAAPLQPGYPTIEQQSPLSQSLQQPLQQQQQQEQQQQQQQQQQILLGIPEHLQSAANVAPWSPTAGSELRENPMFQMDGYPESPFPPQSASPRSPTTSRAGSVQNRQQEQQPPAQLLQQFQLQQMQQFLQQQQQQMQPLRTPAAPRSQPSSTPKANVVTHTNMSPSSALTSKPTPSKPVAGNINRVRGDRARVAKKKTTQGSSTSDKLLSTSSSSDDKFVIFTPKTISSHAGSGSRVNPFECFEAMSATQKGRKGPLADEVKESALQVRRAGACFCCHSRKVKCDAQLPCKNCKKLVTGVPLMVVCWRFDDFLGPLFPDLIRKHFRKDEMATFIADNVASFSINGMDRPCTVRLSSGPAFKSTLEIRGAKLFTATPSAEVLYHTRLTVSSNQMNLDLAKSAPIGLDLSENSPISASQQQERIKKACRAYVDSILKEDAYIYQVTANLKQTELPKKILDIVRRFYLRTNAPIIKQAFSIYTMHYMLAHHLSLTPETLLELAPTGLLPQDTPFLTARLLNRQIKAILDEMMQQEVDALFKMFARALKPKNRTSWATCLAAFLVFCLFMEATGLAIDYFAVTENESDMQKGQRRNPENSRAVAVKMSRALENLPFRQFSYQFHNIYQTYQTPTTSTVSSASSPSSSPSSSVTSGAPALASTSVVKASFNPLVDDGPLLSGDLDKHAAEFVVSLRELIEPGSASWEELDYLTFNPLMDVVEDHPYPLDVAVNYTGRLCSKFLLSFHNERYIFTPE